GSVRDKTVEGLLHHLSEMLLRISPVFASSPECLCPHLIHVICSSVAPPIGGWWEKQLPAVIGGRPRSRRAGRARASDRAMEGCRSWPWPRTAGTPCAAPSTAKRGSPRALH